MRSSTRPAALSDDASDGESGLEVVPTKRDKKPVKYRESKEDLDDDNDVDDDAGNAAGDDNDGGADDDDDEEGDEYVVEKILSHMIAEDVSSRRAGVLNKLHASRC